MADRAALKRRIAGLAEATPDDRDRSVDALRAGAILGVVLGHWLVTAVVDVEGGQLVAASPLTHLPWLAPVSWLFQTLAVFFLVGGYASARSRASARERGIGYGRWLQQRLGRLFRPAASLLSLWAVAFVVMLAWGTDLQTVRTLLVLVLSPMWFLLVYFVLTVATPLATRVHWLWPLAAVAVVDAIRLVAGGPRGVGWVNVVAGWLVPFCLGGAWASGALDRARLGRGGRAAPGAGLLLVGVVATVALLRWGGYPVSMVGVPGEELSNLNPPSLAAVTFGLAQCGVALLLRDALRRAMSNAWAWAVIVVVNLSAMTLFLWHQTAMLAVTAVGLPFGPLGGLHTPPDSVAWVVARLGWLPLFAAALVLCWAAFSGSERQPTARMRRVPR